MSLEQELRDTLRQAADQLGPAHPAAQLRGEGMRALARSRSRRRLAMLSAGLAVLFIGVGIPAGISLIEPADSSVAAPPSPESIPSADIYGGPTRGSLADDAEFVEAVRQLPWTVDGSPLPTEPPVESRRVVFVGDVPQARWALVIGEATVLTQPTGQAPAVSSEPTSTSQPAPSGEAVTGLWGTWFVGVAGADPAQMRLVKDFPISPDEPASMFNPTTGTFVVVAAPGDLIEVSARPEVAADGTVSRSFLDAGTSDGVAVTTVAPEPFGRAGTAAQYRVSRSGVVLDEQGPLGIDDSELADGPQIEIDYLRPSSDPLNRQESAFVQGMAAGILAEYGLGPEEATVRVPYAGPITSLVTAAARLTVVTVTFPSGAVLTRAQWVGDTSGTVDACGAWEGNMSPSGEPAERRILALRCDLNIQSEESSLIVLAPAELAETMAVSDDATELFRLELDSEGVGIVAFPDGATSVTIFAADGTMVDEVPIFTT